MKLSYKDVKRASEMEYEGVGLWAIAILFNVHEQTMRRYLRNYETYGESYWSPYPEEVNDARPTW